VALAATEPRHRLIRDRVTWLVYLQIGIYGWVLYSMGPAIQLLREETGVSKTVSGLHGTAMAAGALLTGVMGARVVQRIGRQASIWMGIAGACFGVVLITVSTALPVTLFGAFCTTWFGSYIVNSVSTVMADHHAGPGASAAVSEAHGMAAAIGLVAPLAIGIAQSTGIGWRAGVLIVLVLAAVLWLTMRDVTIPDHRETLVHHDQPGRRLPPAYWWAWAALVACVAVEFCVSIWASVLLRERVGLSKGAAATGVTALVAGMAVGRFIAGRVAQRVDSARLMYMAIALAGVGWAILWTATNPVLAFGGLVVCGLGIAFHFPIGVMRALATAPGDGDHAAARASIGTGLAIGVGPFALGALADRFSTHTAFLAVPVLLALAAVAVAGSVRAAAVD
jgi:predicted MFS family arabinose efflux permease